jgi:succinate-acetate transporter protein
LSEETIVDHHHSCATIWFGGLLLILAGLLEFVLGNTFPFVVFMGYGAHFLTYGTTFVPYFDAVAAFTTDGSESLTPPFLASFGK